MAAEGSRVAEFHRRARESHAEGRKLLTGMALASVGVLYATLTGKEAPSLGPTDTWCAIAAVAAMAFSAGFGLAAWLADARWAYTVGENFEKDPQRTKPHGGAWHAVKNGCDLSLLVLFVIGVVLVAVLTMRIVSAKAISRGPGPAQIMGSGGR